MSQSRTCPTSSLSSFIVKETCQRVELAINAIRQGKFVVVMDDRDRENEGDLIMAAEKATTQDIAFMVNHTTGIICVSMEEERLRDLKIPAMVNNNTDKHTTAFTVSVDYKHGTSSGVSASDRAATLRALCDPKTMSADLTRPGHMFPLKYRAGGVLVRNGHTEAALDLARLAGLFPAAALSELVNKDGSMMRADDCQRFAQKHKLQFISIQDLIVFRNQTFNKYHQSGFIYSKF